MIVVPREQVAIHDIWHVAGLRGTGSCDYSIDDAFVPESFCFGGLSPARRGSPWARLPGPVVTGTGHAGFALGVARGVLRELETGIAAARRSMAASRTGDRESFKLALGRHATAFDAARTLVFSAYRMAWETACRGAPLTPQQVHRLRISGVYATEVAVEVAHFAFRAAGTAALYDASPLQRALRDILAAQQHVYVADSHYVELAEARIAAADTVQDNPPE
jgi:alkylation response protein AidB-like acyl-CoA dehydrogenase